MSKLEVIGTFPDHVDAQIAKSYLESHGIHVFAHGEHHAAMDWLLQPALQGVRLMTVPQSLRTARNLLSEVPRRENQANPPIAAEIAVGTVMMTSFFVFGELLMMFAPILRRWTRWFQ